MFFVVTIPAKQFKIAVVKRQLRMYAKIEHVVYRVAFGVYSSCSAAFTFVVFIFLFEFAQLVPLPGVVERCGIAAANKLNKPLNCDVFINHIQIKIVESISPLLLF